MADQDHGIPLRPPARPKVEPGPDADVLGAAIEAVLRIHPLYATYAVIPKDAVWRRIEEDVERVVGPIRARLAELREAADG